MFQMLYKFALSAAAMMCTCHISAMSNDVLFKKKIKSVNKLKKKKKKTKQNEG
jgi:hypothetical protein